MNPEQLRNLVQFDKDGVIIWRERPRETFQSVSEWRNWNKRHAGRRVPFKVIEQLTGVSHKSFSSKRKTSGGFERIYFSKKPKKWCLSHRDHDKSAQFDTAIEAAIAADMQAINSRGLFRRVNIELFKPLFKTVPDAKRVYAVVANNDKAAPYLLREDLVSDDKLAELYINWNYWDKRRSAEQPAVPVIRV